MKIVCTCSDMISEECSCIRELVVRGWLCLNSYVPHHVCRTKLTGLLDGWIPPTEQPFCDLIRGIAENFDEKCDNNIPTRKQRGNRKRVRVGAQAVTAVVIALCTMPKKYPRDPVWEDLVDLPMFVRGGQYTSVRAALGLVIGGYVWLWYKKGGGNGGMWHCRGVRWRVRRHPRRWLCGHPRRWLHLHPRSLLRVHWR